MLRCGVLFALILAILSLQENAMGSAVQTPEETKSAQHPSWLDVSKSKLETELVAKYGEAQRERVRRGLKQVGEFWRAEDGDQADFESFVRANFAGDQQTLDTTFARFETLLEKLQGHMQEVEREFRNQADLNLGPMLPLDETFAGFDAGAHVIDDMFRNKLAFVVLLNFPLTTLEQRLNDGQHWTRRQWAEARLAERFSKRVPAEVNQGIAQAYAETAHYIAEYNIWMHHLVNDKGERLFPSGMRLLSHWNLRDEIKADYDVPQNGLARQRAVQQVMERIITQTIPESVINNPQVDWNPWTNEAKPAAVKDSDFVPASVARVSDPGLRVKDPSHTDPREPDTRYAMLQKAYLAERKLDPYSPTAPTHIARRFDENREIPEERVRKMLIDVITSPLAPRVAALIEKRLGRPLEPFDIWYSGFRPKSEYTEAQLDDIVRKHYPTAEAYRKDIPNMLVKLGFAPDRAQYVAENIVVDPARGSGHAMGSSMRDAKVHLRTRVAKEGMNYKGFNIAVHEMGHNVEQTFSMKDVDHWLLHGVPNTAFTEALALPGIPRHLRIALRTCRGLCGEALGEGDSGQG